MTSSWDVFHSVRLEVDRGIATDVVRSRLLAGELNGDDLIRPAGTTRWSRIAQVATFAAPEPLAPPPAPVEAPAPPPAPVPPPVPRVEAPPPVEIPVEPPPVVAASPPEPLRLRPEPELEPKPVSLAELEFPEDDEDSVEAEPVAVPEASFAEQDSIEAELVNLVDSFPPIDDDEPTFEPPVLPDDEAGGPRPPELGDPLPPELETSHDAEDDEASGFTLTRNSTDRVEELDLAAMVDVAFQLVLFFLVTASTIVFKTLEVPKPNEDKPPEAAAPSRARSIDELEKDYILVEVDAEGAVKIDHLPVSSERAALIEKLRQARETTGRKSMLLSADFATRHKNAVLAFDVASEIDLQIAIAQPVGKN